MGKFIVSFLALLAGREITFCTGFASNMNYSGINNPHPRCRQHQDYRTQSCSKEVVVLKVSFGLNDFDVHDANEYERMMIEARECAYSDTSSSEEAQHYLFDIFHMENGCVSGTVDGDYCATNVNEVADVVARLRQKIAAPSSTASGELSTTPVRGDTVSGDPNASDKLSVLGLVVPNVLMILFVGIFVTMMVNSWQPTTADIDAFERHEWSWATQDGYHNTLISHYVRNGGL